MGLLCWGSVRGQSGEYIPKKSVFSDFNGVYSINNEKNIISLGSVRSSLNRIDVTLLNRNFDTIFSTTLVDSFVFNATEVKQGSYKNYYFTYNRNFDTSFHLVKLDSLGKLQWNKRFFNFTVDQILLDKDENVYCLGSKYIPLNLPKFTFDIVISKINKQGSHVWTKTFGGDSIEYAQKFCMINDNKILVSGTSYSDSSGNRSIKNPNKNDAWIFIIDSFGNKSKENSISKINQSVFISDIIKVSENKINLSIAYSVIDSFNKIMRMDSLLNINWYNSVYTGLRQGNTNGIFDKGSKGQLLYFTNDTSHLIVKINDSGKLIWSNKLDYKTIQGSRETLFLSYEHDNFIISTVKDFKNGHQIAPISNDDLKLIRLSKYKGTITGSVFPDFNSNCTYNKPSEYNIPNILIHNKTENTYAITNDSIYTMYLFDRDTAVLKIINLDSNLFVSCGKDSIIVDMTGKTDTSGIDFPIRSNKTGHCVNITSFSSGLLRPGRWEDYQLNYQNNAFDTAYNAYIEIELDTAAVDSIKSPYGFTLTGNILRFNLGHIRPFGHSSLTYSIKLKTTVIIGSSHCHRASVFPICNLYTNISYDSSEIQPMMRCLPNDTVEFTLKNIGLKDQKDWGHSIIYVDELILKKDSFKLTVGNSRIFKYKLDTNTVFTAEVFNSNFHPVTPILIRHNDLCANKRPMIPSNPALNFSRHDEAKEYEEACTIVRGSYDPNIKSVQPVGMFAEHYTSTGTELKYRIDFQNTGTDTAFRVVLVDTLSSFLDIVSFVPGVSSHPYSVEFGGRAVKFIFDPIRLIDSGTNEPASHGYVHFKIKHIAGISPKTKIENKADIYFDYNAPIRTNTVFNTIFDTVQIYVPKGGSAIEENDKTSVIVFPNPTTDKFYIQLSDVVKDLSIEIYDIHGRLIKQVKSNNDKTVEISADGMGKGIYHVRCMSGDKLIVVKKVLVE